jgi:hypothetical protein
MYSANVLWALMFAPSVIVAAVAMIVCLTYSFQGN